LPIKEALASAHPRMSDSNGYPDEVFRTRCMWKWLCAVTRAVRHGKHEQNTIISHILSNLLSHHFRHTSSFVLYPLALLTHCFHTGLSSPSSAFLVCCRVVGLFQHVLTLLAQYFKSSLVQRRVLGFPDAFLVYPRFVGCFRCVISLDCIVP
jgi:hypothetical protein